MTEYVPNPTAWEFGGPKPALTRAQTIRAEGDRIMAQAEEFAIAMAHAKREYDRLSLLAITAWAKAEVLEAMEQPRVRP